MSSKRAPRELRRGRFSRAALRLSIAAAILLLAACATLSPQQADQAYAIAAAARSDASTCDALDACAQPSPLRQMADKALQESTPQQPRHYTVILDRGTDALLARINLIRSATSSIDLQTYIYQDDDAGRLVLQELLDAARRGVRVRVLMDQLSALQSVESLAALSGMHRNFHLKLYNPVMRRARITYPQYAIAAACCWRQLNQRMHTKLLVIDDAVAITGGRNYQDDYFDWSDTYNFRDRDLLVAGPVAHAMAEDFRLFWDDRRAVPPSRLVDVGRLLLSRGVPALAPVEYRRPERAASMRDDAGDVLLVFERLASEAREVGKVEYVSDGPGKHEAETPSEFAAASQSLGGLIASADREVMLQTPYLVLSRPAQAMFERLHDRPDAPRVVVSTNSLAATDAFIAYALSYKYKRRYLRDFGFNIYEYKPFPEDAPIDLQATGAFLPEFVDAPLPPAPSTRPDRSSVLRSARYRKPLAAEYGATRHLRRQSNEPVPLRRAGVRMGMHAKSLVIDRRIGVVGTHNFDPRGDNYNTESAVIVHDAAFARELAASIRRDISPANSWVIAPRDKPPVLSGLEYSIGKISEWLPVFDLWPMRYATSYEFVPGEDCPRPVPPDDPGFRQCYRPVGDFPEVNLALKGLPTRLFTAFGAGLAPIL
ncbi:phospholipase D family protein [Lysobacter sp. H23M47]|uniref:phospholipase D family protein n=1 Tax=Lysobacter sp. H23M47 TaxID=2781024 RepID=UPI001882FFB1|nr:phospholipase D family protein [Lysobacter sp. H23M47]QOW24603.1 phospholipase D family protein [Lysobacter sp. H23M47]